MRIHTLTFAAALACLPASAQELALTIDLIPGHAIYHEHGQEAGVAMALSITPGPDRSTTLLELCDELRAAAGLRTQHEGELRLETIFVVPYKGMAVEGLYLPGNGTLDRNALVRGEGIARSTLDRIPAQAGIPPGILDETNVEHEISCATAEALWFIAWHDVRPISDAQPEAMIERARQRFLAVHQSVLDHNADELQLRQARRAGRG
jgi:hypothetical protein